MATAVWTGSMSLGLVVVPVRLYPAIRKKAVRFHEIDRSGRRVRHMRVAEPDLPTEGFGRATEAEWVPRFETPPRRETPPRAEPPFDQTRRVPETAFGGLRKG